MITEILGISVCVAATYNETEITKLTAFLLQESADPGVRNYVQLGLASINDINWSALPGVRWNSSTGYLQEVYWENKRLSGHLNLSDFAGLRYLYCAYNDLKSVNIKNASILVVADFYENDLEAIDVTTNPLLNWLRLGFNHIRSVDVSNNPNLSFLCCTGNQVETLQVVNKKLLQTLYCAGNGLQSLDLDNCAKLETVSCDANALTSLQLHNLPNLKSLSCLRNALKELQLTNSPLLESLVCYENELTDLDVSFHHQLTTLNCRNNQLTSLNLKGCERLTSLDCDNNFIDILDVTTLPLLTTLRCRYNNLSFFTLPPLTEQLNNNYSYMPQNCVFVDGEFDAIDFRDYYKINDHVSQFIWRYKNLTISPLENNDGLFVFDEKYVGETIECMVHNAVLPKLTMQFSVTFLQGDPVGNKHPQKDGLSVYASERTIHVVTGSPASVSIYSLQGVLWTKRSVDAGHTRIPAERGVSVVVVDGRAHYKVIVR